MRVPVFLRVCVVMEAQPLAFSPPGIRGRSLQHLGKIRRGSCCPGIQLAALQAELCRGPARQLPALLPVGCQGAGGCEKLSVPLSLVFSGLVRGVTGAGDALASLQEGPPGSQLVLGPSCGARTQRTEGWGGAAATAPPREEAVALWGNPSVAVGHIAAGMETETQGFQLGGVCLKSVNTGFRLSPTLTLVIR